MLIVNEPILSAKVKTATFVITFTTHAGLMTVIAKSFLRISQETGWNTSIFGMRSRLTEFTNSAVHMSPKGTAQFAMRLLQAIQELAN